MSEANYGVSLLNDCKYGYVLDTVKPAESGEGTILRLYESAGGRESVTITLPAGTTEASIVNLLEEQLTPLIINEGKIQLSFKPFEIVSVRYAKTEVYKCRDLR